MGNSITIEWGNAAKSDSPIFDLILNKIRKSSSEFENKSRETMFKELFPNYVKGIHPARFLLERTFFRPRDAITYLKLIISKYPMTSYFGPKAFLDLKADYSEYFYNEIRNELSGHLTNDEIDKGTLLLKHFNKHVFKYEDITKYFCANHPSYQNLNLDKILNVFFKFSIIGNKWFNNFKGRDYYCWAYRDNHAILDTKKDMLIHLGLREELSM